MKHFLLHSLLGCWTCTQFVNSSYRWKELGAMSGCSQEYLLWSPVDDIYSTHEDVRSRTDDRPVGGIPKFGGFPLWKSCSLVLHWRKFYSVRVRIWALTYAQRLVSRFKETLTPSCFNWYVCKEEVHLWQLFPQMWTKPSLWHLSCRSWAAKHTLLILRLGAVWMHKMKETVPTWRKFESILREGRPESFAEWVNNQNQSHWNFFVSRSPSRERFSELRKNKYI